MSLPNDKFDTASIMKLKRLSNEDLEPLIPQLLEWLQDINWPVALPVAELLSKQGKEIIEPIRGILCGKDTLWKKSIISELLVHCDSEVLLGLEDEILRILKNPTEDEIKEEVVESARDVFILLSYHDH